MAPRRFTLALAQIPISKNKSDNIKKAVKVAAEAKAKGAYMLVLPECFNGPYSARYFKELSEEIPSGETSQALSKAAKENDMLIVGGSIPEREGNFLYNTCAVWNRNGELVGRHRKIHLSDMYLPGHTFRESHSFTRGNAFTVVDTGAFKMGLGICYDVRFNEMMNIYRDKGVELLVFPAAFNYKMGPLHWEVLMRARALDTQCFVAGVCCARDESAEWVAWAHTMLVDPWGKVLAKAGIDEEVLYAEIDLKTCDEIRQQIPTSKQRRTDLYDTVSYCN